MTYWFNFFPQLKQFTINEEKITKKDQNFVEYNIIGDKKLKSFFQFYDINFSQDELNHFIDKFLSKTIFAMNKDKEMIDLVINIRRGDYYNDKHRHLYGFNQIEYVKNALQSINMKEISSIHIISDDIEWCKNHLSFINHKKVIFPTKSTPIDDFLTLCRAKKLIITNSTFSYWGAYISEYLHNATIIAPNFHNTNFPDNKRNSPNWILLKVDRKDYEMIK